MIGPVYVVTDPDSPHSVLDQARAAARGGAWAVQIRDKGASDAEIAMLTREIMAELAPLGVRVFVNDRVAVARDTGADLHIGQGDGDARAARAQIAPEALLGLSIDALPQCAAIPEGVDYIGIGPLRATSTKPDAASPLGFEGIAAIAAASPVPSVAIGGITAEDARALRKTGVSGMAIVSAVTRAADPEAATRALLEAWSKT